MPVLTTQQRNTLETGVKQARKLAETGARNTLQALAIDNLEPFAHMNPKQRDLRNRLRNKARLLGDTLGSNGPQEINHLSYELAYENWHKMLFAKFLEANNLLMHPSGGSIQEQLTGDLLASDIRRCLYYLGTITGEITNEDQLDFIFSKFCIGK